MNIHEILQELRDLDLAGRGREADRREAQVKETLRRLAIDNSDLAALWEQNPHDNPRPQRLMAEPDIAQHVPDVRSGVRYIFQKEEHDRQDPWATPSNNFYVVTKPDGKIAVVHSAHTGGVDLPQGWKLEYDHKGQGI